jgi:hypothetical protein
VRTLASATRLELVELVSLLVGLGYTAAVVVFVARHCYFYGDDFSGFLLSRTEHFIAYLLFSVGGQVVPLARLLDAAFFRVAGLSYGAAVGTLVALHVVGTVYLYRTLSLLGRSPANAVLTALYACYIYTWVQLGWWIAGLERVPFMALSAMAVFHSVRHEQTGRRRELVAASVLDLLALGFYSKALLLPFCMVGLDVARIPFRELRARSRFFAVRWITAAGVFAVTLLFWLQEHAAAGVPIGGTTLKDLYQFVQLGLLSYAHSAFAVPLSPASYSPRAVVGVLWFLLVGYTCYRAPRAALAWLVLFALLFANLLVFGLSSRVAQFGTFMAFEVRYYWELWFFSVLFLGVVLKQLPATTREATWVLAAPKGAAQGLVAALLVSYAFLAYRGFSTTALSDSDPLPKTRAFVATLSAELKRLNSSEAPLKLSDDYLPPYVVGLDFSFIRQSQLLFLMGQRVMYCLPGKADYRITPDGHIIPVDPRAHPP